MKINRKDLRIIIKKIILESEDSSDNSDLTSSYNTAYYTGKAISKSVSKINNADRLINSGSNQSSLLERLAKQILSYGPVKKIIEETRNFIFSSSSFLEELSPYLAEQMSKIVKFLSSKAETYQLASRFSKAFKFAGELSFYLFVIDMFLIPYRLSAYGTIFDIKVATGIDDMKTPWGQLTYRKKILKRPSKPSDFDNEYKNIIAAIIWNQKNSQECKNWVIEAIKKDLLDLEAWKEYLEPLRKGEANLTKAIQEVGLDKTTTSFYTTAQEDVSDLSSSLKKI